MRARASSIAWRSEARNRPNMPRSAYLPSPTTSRTVMGVTRGTGVACMT